MLTLDRLNTCSADEFVTLLDGIYEHSPWVAERTAAQRPFPTLAALKYALQQTVRLADADTQLGLIRAHPELAGQHTAAGTLTAASTEEQASAGLDGRGSADAQRDAELETLQTLNAAYRARFGFPFVIAVKGHDGRGMPRAAIIAALERRLRAQIADETAESLRQIGRIAELRLNQRCGLMPVLGAQALAACDTLAQWSDTPQGLTCTYLSPSHRRSAEQIAVWMRAAGMAVHIDAIGNVVGRYRSNSSSMHPGDTKTLLTGSHYDTVVNAGRYDGRAGILVALAAVEHLHRAGVRLPFHLEVVAFADEEGVRYRHTLLGSSALAGSFDPSWLNSVDGDGIALRDALRDAGHDPDAIPALARTRDDLLGFVEIHIEQGPVLLERGLPLGIVDAIAGSCRYVLALSGTAGHAGTVPMALRRDAAAAAAEIVLLVERICRDAAGVVGTVGQLEVPGGSINVIPGHCRLSLDIRAGDDALRDAALADILRGIEAICARRGVSHTLEPVLRTAATPCAPWLSAQLGKAVARSGLEVVTLPSGAGHDGLALSKITDIAMLFVRCGNGGISHHPLETVSADDLDLAATVFVDFLRHFTPAIAP